MSFEYLNQISQRYTNLLENRGETLRKNEVDDQTDHGHLLWMLEEIRSNPEQSETKKNRWLGFVQGILVKDGLLEVYEERELTRPVFNGK